MSTISVPLPAHLMTRLSEMVESTGASKAAIMRKALERYSEEQAINAVLLAAKEPTLSGDLDELLAKI